jgi:hypothetical protein
LWADPQPVPPWESGDGDAVSVGGGKIGGLGKKAPNAATNGKDGLVEVRWSRSLRLA